MFNIKIIFGDDIVDALIDNVTLFVKSLPTTVVALLIIAFILKLMGITIKGIIRTIIGAMVVSIVLGAFGVRSPSFSEIFNFLVNLFNKFKTFIGTLI